MIESIRIVGARGRVGSAVSARLAERGVRLDGDEPELVLLCVPDRSDRRGCRGDRRRPVGRARQRRHAARRPRPAHATVRRCTRCSRSRRRAGRSSSTAPGRRSPPRTARRARSGSGSRETLGLRPFELDDANRAAYHAGAAFASNYLVTLRAPHGSLLEAAGVPPEALDPLMRGVIDTGFELTGPIARGDWETVERHLAVIRAERPELEELYLVLAAETARIAGRDPQEVPA